MLFDNEIDDTGDESIIGGKKDDVFYSTCEIVPLPLPSGVNSALLECQSESTAAARSSLSDSAVGAQQADVLASVEGITRIWREVQREA